MAKKVKDVKAPNRTVNFNAGNNIKLEGSGDNVTVATVDDARFNSVTTGNVSMSTEVSMLVGIKLPMYNLVAIH